MNTSTITQHDVGTSSSPTTEFSAQLPVSGITAVVTVYYPARRFGELQPSRVNWSALGSQAARDAELYAQLLVQASAFAGRLDTEHGFDV